MRSSTGRSIIAAAVLGSALAYMSDDMLNVSLPTISRDLAVTVADMQWVVNAYFVSMLSLILIAGSIGDIRGHRRMFLGGLGIFVGGALLSAMAPTIALLVAGRAIQGFGAAFVLASALALVSSSFPEDERGQAVGVYMGLTAVATALGPPLGGLIVDVITWRAIFLAPLVLPLAAVIVTVAKVPESVLDETRHPDVLGAGLALVTIASFSFFLIRGPDDWTRPSTLGAIAVSTLSAFLILRHQKRTPNAMLPVRLFRVRTFSGGNLITLISYLVSAGAFFFVVVQLQTTLGYNPAAAGASMTPLYIIMLMGSPLAGRVADAVGARIPVVGGLIVLAGGVRWLSLVDAEAQFVTQILPGLVVLSIGLALIGAPLTSAILGSVGEHDQGVASGVNNAVGQLAGLLMIAILPAVAGLTAQDLYGPGFSVGYAKAMQVCAVLALLAAPIAAFTLRTKPSQSETHRRADPVSDSASGR